MCGIVGTLALSGQIDRGLLARQCDTLVHRGPDGEGLWIDESKRVGLAHRRLAVIDLTAGGHQPMIDGRSGCAITFNGEIYNFQELRSVLQASGRSFVSRSDTEVILAAYLEWGESMVERLQGMFAFAIFDPRRRGVLLARDRAGEKPLYIYRGAGFLHFASEVKALWADPRVPRNIDASALDQLLAYGYGPCDRAVVRDITKLPAASAAWVDAASGTIRQWKYWVLPSFAARSTVPPTAAAEDRLDELQSIMTTAVQRQMISDVPLGILLSGGLDSSLVAALANRAPGRSVKTFTVSFPDSPAHDESGFARKVADYLGTQHIQIDAEPATADLLHSLAIQFDDPISDSSMLPTFLVSKAIRAHATVALGGDGGDELFGGYLRHPGVLKIEKYRRRVPKFLRRVGASVANMTPYETRGRTSLIGLGMDANMSVSLAGRLLGPEERRALSPLLRSLPDFRLDAPERRRAAIVAQQGSVLQKATALDFLEYLPEDVLTKVDRASMLASLEVRAPLLDTSLVDFAFGRLPDGDRATSTARKVILRKLAKRLLPAGLDVTRKQGFSIPLQRWIAKDWNSMVREALHTAPSWLVDPKPGLRLLDRVERGGRGADTVFALVMLSLWSRHYRVESVEQGVDTN